MMSDKFAREHIEQSNALADAVTKAWQRADLLLGNRALSMQVAAKCVLRQEAMIAYSVDLYDPVPTTVSGLLSVLYKKAEAQRRFEVALDAINDLIETTKNEALKIAWCFKDYMAKKTPPDHAVLQEMHDALFIHRIRGTAARFWMVWLACKSEPHMSAAVLLALTNVCLMMSQVPRDEVFNCAKFFEGTYFLKEPSAKLDLSDWPYHTDQSRAALAEIDHR